MNEDNKTENQAAEGPIATIDPFEMLRASVGAYVDLLKKTSAHTEVHLDVNEGHLEIKVQGAWKVKIQDVVNYVKLMLDAHGLNIIP